MKAQGQTLERMGLALQNYNCFGHGQLFVACSRVTRLSGIKIFAPSSKESGHVVNIVYRGLLSDHVHVRPINRTHLIQPSNNWSDFGVDDEYVDF